METRKNPYLPQAGISPLVFTGRERELHLFADILDRLSDGLVDPFPVVTGLRGVGKTVLLNTFEGLALERGWQALYAEVGGESAFREIVALWAQLSMSGIRPGKTLREQFKRRLSGMANFAITVSTSGDISITVGAVRQGEGASLPGDLTQLFLELGTAAREKNTGVALLLDEVQGLPRSEFTALIMSLHRCAQKQLPVAFAGAGLPQLPRLAGEARSYAERLFDFISIGRLDREDAAKALIEPARMRDVEWHSAAVDAVLKHSDCYPYFIQQYAKHAWLHAPKSPIRRDDVDRSAPEALRRLDASFFEVRYQRTSARERVYLNAMARIAQPCKSSEVVNQLPGRSSSWSVHRNSLINKGVIYSPRYATLDFTVPHFGEFLLRREAMQSPEG